MHLYLIHHGESVDNVTGLPPVCPAERVRLFVDMPEALGAHTAWNCCVGVVAHGIILIVLTRSLVSRFPGGSLPFSGAQGTQWGGHTVPFRNTGYLEATIHVPNDSTKPRLDVLGVNCTEHLNGLRKTRGGIGSAKFDVKRKTLDCFLKPASKTAPSDAPERS